MPARRRAPQGGRFANIRFPMPVFRQNLRLEKLPQNVKLFLREPLGRFFLPCKEGCPSKT